MKKTSEASSAQQQLSSLDVERLSRFFFLTLLNDKLADQAIISAWKIFRRSMRNKTPEVTSDILLIEASYIIWKKIFRRNKLTDMAPSHSTYWRITSGLDLASWFELRKSIDPEIFFPLVWSHVIKVSDSDLSQAMGITQGTARYRVGKGILALGQLSNQYEMRA